MKKKETEEPHWRLVERIVASLEQVLVPGASVEHNRQLYDSHADEWRQCDVVIRQGNPPRETITIVEVQDRPNNRVGLQTFEGWYKKREKLNAQHLICVSVKGFTKGVISEARNYGATVRLLELTELEENASPLNFRDGKLDFFWGNPRLDSWSIIARDNTRPGKQFKRKDVDFKYNNSSIQLNHLFAQYFPAIDIPTTEGTHDLRLRINFGQDDELLLIWGNNQAKVLTITGLYKVKVRRAVLSMTTSQYKQIDYNGTLAWSIIGTGQIDEKEAILRLIFLPAGNGLLKLAEAQATGVFDGLPGGVLRFQITK